MSNPEEKLPVHDAITVLEYTTLYKTQKWWCAIVQAESFDHKKVLIYLWINKDGKWKRKGKFSINSKKDWDNMKPIIEDYVQKAGI